MAAASVASLCKIVHIVLVSPIRTSPSEQECRALNPLRELNRYNTESCSEQIPARSPGMTKRCIPACMPTFVERSGKLPAGSERSSQLEGALSINDIKQGWERYFSNQYLTDASPLTAERKLRQRRKEWDKLVRDMQRSGVWDELKQDTRLSLGAYRERDDFYIFDQEVYDLTEVKKWIKYHPSWEGSPGDSSVTEGQTTIRKAHFAGDTKSTSAVEHECPGQTGYPRVPGCCGPKYS